jgi:hypothetical protein
MRKNARDLFELRRDDPAPAKLWWMGANIFAVDAANQRECS